LVHPPVDVRSDWKIIKVFGNLFNINLPFFDLNQIGYNLNTLSPLHSLKFKELNTLNLDLSKTNYIYKIWNNFFSIPNYNYYTKDSISRSSKIMLDCSNKFLTKKSNYKKFI
jgi:hypothetical protein